MGKPRFGYLDVRRLPFNEKTATNHTALAAITGKVIRVLSYTLTTAAEVGLTFKSDSTTIAGPMPLSAGVSPPYNPEGHFDTASGEALVITLDDAVEVGGHLTVAIVDP